MDVSKRKKQFGGLVSHTSIRPLKIIRDKRGIRWLCYEDCKPKRPCATGGCWPMDTLGFNQVNNKLRLSKK